MKEGMKTGLIAAFAMGLIAIIISGAQSRPHSAESLFRVTPGTTSSKLNEVIKDMRPGTTLQFAPGVYQLEATIKIEKKSGIIIEGDGAELVLNKNDSVVFWISNSDNIVLRGFIARHEIPIKPGERCMAGVIYIGGSHDISLENLELNGSGTHGLQIQSSASVTLKDSWLHHNSVAALGIYRAVDNISIENNRADNNPQWLETNLSEEELTRFVVFQGNKTE